MRRRGRGFTDDEIDDAVGEWHDSPAGEAEYVDLDVYLGWGRAEYSAWVERPSTMSIIVLRGEARPHAELDALIARARTRVMTDAEREAQRESWARGEAELARLDREERRTGVPEAPR